MKSARTRCRRCCSRGPCRRCRRSTLQRSAEAASSHFGTMHSVTRRTSRLVPVHVPSLLPSPGIRVAGAVALLADAARDHLRRLAARRARRERRIFATQTRGTEPQERLPSAPGAGAQLAELLGDAADVVGWRGAVARAGGVELGLGGLGAASQSARSPEPAAPGVSMVRARAMAATIPRVLLIGEVLRRDWQRPLSYVAPSRASGFAGRARRRASPRQ
jgi:hypothetical protein